MSDVPLPLKLAEGSLRAVPAVHFRSAFAECVHHLCVKSETRPNAIAVELGPQTAAAAAAWLKELGVGPKNRLTLPCMLGLAKSNLRIKSSKRELAGRLQSDMKRDINELPPDLLKELLGYSALRVLYLSPTDSIIEAIRCALELSLPLYGIDLEETAEREPVDAMIEDPDMARERVREYVEGNAPFAEHWRDEEVDSRRELTMATRLKSVLAEHGNVLFTGGLAHWTRLRKLLSDANYPPAPIRPVSGIEATGFTRIVVHPLLAIYHLDLFPAFAEVYEGQRQQANRPTTVINPLNTTILFKNLLQAAYDEHFGRKDADEQLDRLGGDGEALYDFERLLATLMLVKQRSVPDIFTALTAARGTMSSQFCEALAEKLMEHAWIRPDDYPALPCLIPVSVTTGRFIRAELIERDLKRHGYCYVTSLPGGSSLRLQVPIPWLEGGIEWGGTTLVGPRPNCSERRTWGPWDRIMTAMSLRAREVARGEREKPLIEVFEGSLMDGVHVKATLRSHIRGEDRVYVQERRQPPKLAPRYHDGWPIVWIFRMAHNPESRWQTAIEWMNSFKTHVHDPELLGRIMQEQGTRAIWMIEFCRPSSSHPRDPHGLIDLYSLDGLLIYAPTHFTLHQSARWAEDTSYKRMPVCHELESVESFFKSHHNLDVSQGDWRANMVRMAIPYASTAVTVVAPDGFTLPRAVFEQAGRQSVEVRIVPLSYFPREMVRTLSMPCFVPVENDPVTREFRYVEYAQHVLNEKPSANKELLSAYWQNYGLTGS